MKTKSTKNLLKTSKHHSLDNFLRVKNKKEKPKLLSVPQENTCSQSQKCQLSQTINLNKSMPWLKSKLEKGIPSSLSKLKNKNWRKILKVKHGTQNISKIKNLLKRGLWTQYWERRVWENGKIRRSWKNNWKRYWLLIPWWECSSRSHLRVRLWRIEMGKLRKYTINGFRIRGN